MPALQELVEHALAASTADDCVVIAHHRTSANLRWANNTLTTNGVMRGIDVTVIAFARQSGGVQRGSVSGSAASPEQVDALVAAADAAARAADPASDAHDLVDGDGRRRLGRRTRRDRRSTSSTPSPRPSARRSAGPAAGGRILYGFVDHHVTTTYVGSSTGLRLRHEQPTGHYACTGKTADLSSSAWVGGATRDFVGVDALALEATLAQRPRLGAPDGRPARRPLRHDPAADRGRGPDDRRLLVRRRARRPRRAVGLQPPRRRHPDRRARSVRPGGRRSPPTRRTPGWSARRHVVVGVVRQRPQSVFDNGLPLGPHRLDRPTAGSPRCCQTRQTAALTGQPVTPAIDNLVLEVDGATGGDRRPGRRHRARAAADLPVVHPRGRPADPAAHRADPRRRLPRRERRDHRRGQQLPLQREPGRPAAALHPRLGDRAGVQPRVGRRLLLAHRDARPAGARLQHVERLAGPVMDQPRDFVVPDSPAARRHVSRATVRVLVLDHDGRMLLFQDSDPGVGASWWITPGGGIDPGEREHETVVRELEEETGLQVMHERRDRADRPGTCGTATPTWWSSRTRRSMRAGARVRGRHRRPHRGGEGDDRSPVRWWTPAEVATSDEEIWPVLLLDLVTLLDTPDAWPVALDPVEESSVPV